MRLEAPGVRIADVETCDFGLMARYDTAALLHAALPARAGAWQRSAVARRMLAELGVAHRHLTHVPGATADPARPTAFDLARSAVARLQARRPAALAELDALIFVSASNPNPVNSQAAMLAAECGLTASCYDLKAGCSSGVLGLVQAALLLRAGCRRALVVMAENLSQLTDPAEPRMLLTVGDGAACVLLERAEGPGFLTMVHGSAPRFAHTMTVRMPFPPADPSSRYVFEVDDAAAGAEFLHATWRSVFRETIAAAGLEPSDLALAALHQTHGAQIDGLVRDLGLAPECVPSVVRDHGNMGTPTFAVALARGFASLKPGDRYLLQAVGGGISWCAIVAEHA